MNDNKNMILAIALSALVILGWGLVSEYWFPAANPPVTKVEKGREVPVARPQADPTADSPAAIRDRRIVLAETPRIRVGLRPEPDERRFQHQATVDDVAASFQEEPGWAGRKFLPDPLEGLLGIRGLAEGCAFERARQNLFETLAHDGVIICDQYA